MLSSMAPTADLVLEPRSQLHVQSALEDGVINPGFDCQDVKMSTAVVFVNVPWLARFQVVR